MIKGRMCKSIEDVEKNTLYLAGSSSTKLSISREERKNAKLKVRGKREKGITLIALVVTIVVLLILAGVTITVLFGDNGIFKTAKNATNQFGIEAEREKINNVLIDWWTKKVTGENVTVEDFFKMLQPDIITDRGDVTGPDDNNIYIVETNNGYTVEIIVDEKGNIQIGDIEKGNLNPKIRDIKISTTENSITAKATVARAEGKTVTYEYKLETEPDSSYKPMTANADGSYIATGLTANANYNIRVRINPTDPQVEEIRTAIARDCTVTGITLDKTAAEVEEGKEITLQATITPDYAEDKSITWTSSAEDVATVDGQGKVKGVKAGTATIAATANGRSNKKATCTITVIEAESDWALIGRIAKHIATRTDITINEDTQSVSGTTAEGDKYNVEVGDTFKVRYSDVENSKQSGIKTVRIIGFKHDDLVDQNIYGKTVQKAGISFDFVNYFIDGVYKSMNPNAKCTEGWAATEMREYLNGYNSKTIDTSKVGVQGGETAKLSNSSQIKKVKKEYIATYNTKVETLPQTEDYLWMLSCAEIWSDGYNGGETRGYAIQKEGNQYKYYKNIQQTENKTYKYSDNNPLLIKGWYLWGLRSLHAIYEGYFCLVSSTR